MSEIRSTQMLQVTPCPHCGYKIEVATSLEGQTPFPGAITICFGCLGVSVYAEDMDLIPVPEGEIAQKLGHDAALGIATSREGIKRAKARRAEANRRN